MSVFIVVGLVAVLMLFYMISVLGALPWFTYIPFILLFALVFYWNKIRSMLPWFRRVSSPRSSAAGSGRRKTGVKSAKRGRRNVGGGKRGGKRM